MLPKSAAGHTFICLRFQDLTAGLVLKLIVLTQEVVTEGATKYPSPVVPYTAFALNAVCIGEGTLTGMGAQTLPAVTDPGFTEVTHRPDHSHPSAVDPWVFDHTI